MGGSNGRTKRHQMPPPEGTRKRGKRGTQWISMNLWRVGEVRPPKCGSPNFLHLFSSYHSRVHRRSASLVNLVSRLAYPCSPSLSFLCKMRSPIHHFTMPATRLCILYVLQVLDSTRYPSLPFVTLTLALCPAYCTSTSSSLCNP